MKRQLSPPTTMQVMILAWLAMVALGAQAASESPAYDLVIRGARVLDGTGTPWFFADVGVSGDRIVAVGKLPADVSAKRTIDAAGQYLAPGFIDAHSHARD